MSVIYVLSQLYFDWTSLILYHKRLEILEKNKFLLSVWYWKFLSWKESILCELSCFGPLGNAVLFLGNHFLKMSIPGSQREALLTALMDAWKYLVIKITKGCYCIYCLGKSGLLNILQGTGTINTTS